MNRRKFLGTAMLSASAVSMQLAAAALPPLQAVGEPSGVVVEWNFMLFDYAGILGVCGTDARGHRHAARFRIPKYVGRNFRDAEEAARRCPEQVAYAKRVVETVLRAGNGFPPEHVVAGNELLIG